MMRKRARSLFYASPGAHTVLMRHRNISNMTRKRVSNRLRAQRRFEIVPLTPPTLPPFLPEPLPPFFPVVAIGGGGGTVM